jgi:hypothetical protein
MLPVVFVSNFLRLEAKSPKVAGHGANPKSFVNRAPAYLVFQDRPEDPFILLRDGAIFGTEDYPEQKISSG